MDEDAGEDPDCAFDLVRRYFPRDTEVSDDDFAFPLPTSPDFWHVYWEPIDLLLLEIQRFRENYEALSWWCKPRFITRKPEHRGVEVGQGKARARQALKRFKLHLDSNESSIDLGDATPDEHESFAGGTLEETYAAPSLLSMLSRMLLRDLQNRELGPRVCRSCSTQFFPRSYQQIRCSKRCLDADKNAKKRARKIAEAEAKEARRASRAAKRAAAKAASQAPSRASHPDADLFRVAVGLQRDLDTHTDEMIEKLKQVAKRKGKSNDEGNHGKA